LHAEVQAAKQVQAEAEVTLCVCGAVVLVCLAVSLASN
jgi:hypothetical protein